MSASKRHFTFFNKRIYMRKRINLILFSLNLIILSAFAQVEMGKWQTHFAYNSINQIAQSNTKIYAVSDGALFSVSKLDGDGAVQEFYSKVSGLNGNNISRIEFDPTSNQLLIVYSNGNIDLLTSGGVINLPDLFNKQMSAKKEVNQIYFYQGKAYLACNFGIVALNMQKKEVSDTYIIGANASEVKVLSIAVNKGQIYALTNSVVYTASVDEKNLVNYEYWNTSATAKIPGSGDFQYVGSFADKLFILRGNKLYKKEESGWMSFLPQLSVNYFTVSNGKMLLNTPGNTICIVDESLNYKIINNIGTISDAEYDNLNDNYWFAANASGIKKYKQLDNLTATLDSIKPHGPAVNIPWDMTFAGKKLFVVPGGREAGQFGRTGAVMMYENYKWTNLLNAPIQDSLNAPVLDFMNVAVDPTDDKHFFVTSFGNGLFEFKNNKFANWHNHLNSTLHTVAPGDPFNYIRLDGAIFDKNRNLFIPNMGGEKSAFIKILLANGNWTSLTYTFSYIKQDVIPDLGKMLISNQNPNQKWIPSYRYEPGICVFDDKGTLSNVSDDDKIFIESMTYTDTDGSGKTVEQTVTPNNVFCLAQDKNGVIWVGTDMGPFLYQNLSKVFNPGYTCSRVKIPRNDGTNLADYLLANEGVTAIAIDGANRKWIGTSSSGVYLMSENGQETIKHFTASNSPLLSNNILSIAINPVTGEVFFGTEQGIASYQGNAANAGETFGDVYAYPNPVRENFTGIITIVGLVENTQVKITDISGNLVCQTVSNGSIATWDGKDIHGRKVNTGIYLAMCTNSDGTQSSITKIMVIN